MQPSAAAARLRLRSAVVAPPVACAAPRRALPALRAAPPALHRCRARRAVLRRCSDARAEASGDRSSADAATPPLPHGAQPSALGAGAIDYSSLYTRFLTVAKPYWTDPEQKKDALLRLGGVVALTLGTTGISVGFNFLGRDFFNAISEKHPDDFYRLLFTYIAAIAGAIPVFVMRDYWQSVLSLRWRAWLTERYVDSYMRDRTFYRIAAEGTVDNPDQRINADIGAFTGTALGFVLTLFNSAIDLVSFSGILFSIYTPLFFVLIVYALGGTAVSVALGQKLVGLNFAQEAREADFRYALVRVRENAESIAFYGGEAAEAALLRQRFNAALANLRDILLASRNLSFFTSSYRFLISFLPAAVVAPLYFRGEIEFGVINQSSSAFNHILSDVSLVVYQFEALAGFAATIDRIGQFEEALHAPPGDEPRITRAPLLMPSAADPAATSAAPPAGPLLRVDSLTLAPPRAPPAAPPLIRDLSFSVYPGEHLLIMGSSGSGKTSLLRALGGLWSGGSGVVSLASSAAAAARESGVDGAAATAAAAATSAASPRDVFFLPQRPYLVLGTLRQQLLYPLWASGTATSADAAAADPASAAPATNGTSPSLKEPPLPPPPNDAAIAAALRAVSLEGLLSRPAGLDAPADWASVLSLGEQQRLAFARLLLARPRLALLDESSSALDGAAEAAAYAALRAVGTTYVSVGHRDSLRHLHARLLRLQGDGDGGWALAPIAPGAAAGATLTREA